jgi:hypothetical protein
MLNFYKFLLKQITFLLIFYSAPGAVRGAENAQCVAGTSINIDYSHVEPVNRAKVFDSAGREVETNQSIVVFRVFFGPDTISKIERFSEAHRLCRTYVKVGDAIVAKDLFSPFNKLGNLREHSLAIFSITSELERESHILSSLVSHNAEISIIVR